MSRWQCHSDSSMRGMRLRDLLLLCGIALAGCASNRGRSSLEGAWSATAATDEHASQSGASSLEPPCIFIRGDGVIDFSQSFFAIYGDVSPLRHRGDCVQAQDGRTRIEVIGESYSPDHSFIVLRELDNQQASNVRGIIVISASLTTHDTMRIDISGFPADKETAAVRTQTSWFRRVASIEGQRGENGTVEGASTKRSEALH